jgi:hypothetical protein
MEDDGRNEMLDKIATYGMLVLGKVAMLTGAKPWTN